MCDFIKLDAVADLVIYHIIMILHPSDCQALIRTSRRYNDIWKKYGCFDDYWRLNGERLQIDTTYYTGFKFRDSIKLNYKLYFTCMDFLKHITPVIGNNDNQSQIVLEIALNAVSNADLCTLDYVLEHFPVNGSYFEYLADYTKHDITRRHLLILYMNTDTPNLKVFASILYNTIKTRKLDPPCNCGDISIGRRNYHNCNDAYDRLRSPSKMFEIVDNITTTAQQAKIYGLFNFPSMIFAFWLRRQLREIPPLMAMFKRYGDSSRLNVLLKNAVKYDYASNKKLSPSQNHVDRGHFRKRQQSLIQYAIDNGADNIENELVNATILGKVELMYTLLNNTDWSGEILAAKIKKLFLFAGAAKREESLEYLNQMHDGDYTQVEEIQKHGKYIEGVLRKMYPGENFDIYLDICEQNEECFEDCWKKLRIKRCKDLIDKWKKSK